MAGAKKFEKVKNHTHYFRNKKTEVIYFRKRKDGVLTEFSTKETGIVKAKIFVEKKLEELKHVKKKGLVDSKPNAFIEDLWEKLIEDKRSDGISDSTLKKYSMHWSTALSGFFKDLNVRDINQAKIIEFEKWYLRVHPTRGYFNTRKHLVSFVKFLRKAGYQIEEIEFKKLDSVIDKRTKKKPVGRVYSKAEIKALLKAATPQVRFLILVSYKTGLRVGEALSLKSSDYDKETGILSVWMSKTSRYKEIPLGPKLLQEFIDFDEKLSGSVYFFESVDRAGKVKPMNEATMNKRWTETKVKAGIKGAKIKNASRFHDLRHTCASNFAENNVSVTVACSILGMSLEEFEKTYLHVNTASRREVMERFDEDL